LAVSFDAYRQAIDFIAKDVGRELELAKAPREALQSCGVTPGGGNVLVALGLTCYTEFGGKVKYGRGNAKANFNAFFSDLGKSYAETAATHDVYNIVRCGLAHEYFVKRNCEINMFGAVSSGVVVNLDGTFVVTVERYFTDLMKAFNALGRDLFPQWWASA
jgi:hypothetical protein